MNPPRVNAPLPQAVVQEMARRDYRMHHLLWHEIRRYWLQYPRDVQDKIRQLGWEPPRPARDENEAPILNNDSGQDFLYLHKQLSQRVNAILTEVGDPDYPQVEGWLHLPGPDDPDYPVPPPWFDPGDLPIRSRYLVRIKSDVVFQKHFRIWERTFSDPVYLRGVSLGEFGAMLDFYLVDPVRRRWAAAPGATRPAATPVESDAIATDWDHPRYDYLGDYYSMHVNPIYWRFFGWIEDRVEEWKAANGVFGTDFWTAKWVGKLPEAQPAAQSPTAGPGTPPPSGNGGGQPGGKGGGQPSGNGGGQPAAAQSAQDNLAEMSELVRTIAASGAVSSLRPDDLRLFDVLEPSTGGGHRSEPHLVGVGGHH